jgi:hypothetical protein
MWPSSFFQQVLSKVSGTVNESLRKTKQASPDLGEQQIPFTDESIDLHIFTGSRGY